MRALGWIASAFLVGSLSLTVLIVWGAIADDMRRRSAYRRDLGLRPMPGEVWDHDGCPIRISSIDEDGVVFSVEGDLHFESWAEWRLAVERVRRFRARGPMNARGLEIRNVPQPPAPRAMLH